MAAGLIAQVTTAGDMQVPSTFKSSLRAHEANVVAWKTFNFVGVGEFVYVNAQDASDDLAARDDAAHARAISTLTPRNGSGV